MMISEGLLWILRSLRNIIINVYTKFIIPNIVCRLKNIDYSLNSFLFLTVCPTYIDIFKYEEVNIVSDI